jgi:hypothetical protein
MMKRFVFLALFFLVACVPALRDTRPKVAFVNAPTDKRVTGLAETLETLIKVQTTPFGFSRSSALRFQETHRDMYGSRAPLQAAFIARSQGALYAVMIGFENDGDVLRLGLNADRIELTLKLDGYTRASIVDPTSAEVLATFDSSTVTAETHEVVTLALPQGITPLDPKAKPYIEQQVRRAKERALEQFLSDNAEKVVGELTQPLIDELSRRIPLVPR